MPANMTLGSQSSSATPEKFRVLIIEDDPYIARLVLTNLAKVNLECRIAPDGLSGLSDFKEFNPHLVLTDIMMPGLNGRSVTSVIRESSMVPILMMTAADTSEAELESFKAGADDYIPKPFDPKLLSARVIAHLRRVYRYDADAYAVQATTPAAASSASGATTATAATAAAVAGGDSEAGSGVMQGRAQCRVCGYNAGVELFKRENAKGQRFLVCPQCQEIGNIAFS